MHSQFAAKAGALFMRNNYDKLGRITSVYDAFYGVNIKTTQYNGLTTTHTSSPGGFQADQTSVTTKNVAGQTAQIQDAQGGLIKYRYDANDNLISTDASGIVTQLRYDRRGRRVKNHATA